jgi:hypothetical protein
MLNKHIKRIKAIFNPILKRINLVIGRSALIKYSHSVDGFIKNYFNHKSSLLILDVGAHYGESASSYIRLFDNARIVSFEPNINAFLKFKEIRNTRVHCHNIGFDNFTGVSRLYLNDHDSMNSLNTLIKSTNKSNQNKSIKSSSFL